MRSEGPLSASLRESSLWHSLLESFHAGAVADDRLDGGHRIREHPVFLVVDPSTRGVLALETAVPLPGSYSNLDNDVDRNRDHHRAVAACLDLQDRLDVDSGCNALSNWIIALQNFRKALQWSATKRCG